MFCGNCGTQLQDSDMFCPNCGLPVQSGAAPAISAENGEKAGTKSAKNLTEKEMEAAKSGGRGKKSKKKIIIPIVAAAAAAAVLIAVIVIVNFDRLNNFVHKTFSSPEEYYQFVEKKNVDELSSIIGDIYEQRLLNVKDFFDTTSSAGLSLELGRSGKDLLELAGIAGVDLSWVESIAFSGGLTMKDDRMEVNLSTAMNKSDILSLVMAVDMKEGEVFLQIPEMTDTYIGLEAEEFMSSSQIDDMLDAWEEARETFDDTFDALPSQERLEGLLTKYMEIALGCVKDVEKKSRNLKVEGVEQNCILLEVTLDDDTLEDVLEAILDEAEDDKDLEKLFIDIGDAFEEDGGDIYDDLIDSLESFLNDMRYFSGGELVMSVYVDDRGKVVGREMETDEVTIALLMPQNGSEFGYEFSVIDDGNINFALTGSGERSGDRIDGEFRLRYEGTSILEITTENLDLKTLKRGQLNGELEVGVGPGIRTLLGSVPGMSILQNVRIGVSAKTSADTFEYGVSLVNDGKEMGTVTISAERKSASDVNIPSGKNVVFVEDERDFEDWVETINWDNVVTRLEDAGLPRSVTRTVKEIGKAIEEDGLDIVMDVLRRLEWRGLRGFTFSPPWGTSYDSSAPNYE